MHLAISHVRIVIGHHLLLRVVDFPMGKTLKLG